MYFFLMRIIFMNGEKQEEDDGEGNNERQKSQ